MNSLVRTWCAILGLVAPALVVAAGCGPDIPRGPSRPADSGAAPPRVSPPAVAISVDPNGDTLDGGGTGADDAAGGDDDAGADAGPGAKPSPSDPRNRDDGGTASQPVGDGDAGSAAVDGEPGRAPLAGEVLITELLINPTGTDTGREWIEIKNVASVALDLTALHVADAVSEIAVPLPRLLPGQIALLAQSADPSKNGGVIPDAVVGTRLALNNDRDSVTLCLGPCTDAVVLDSFSWTSLGAAADGHALVLEPPRAGERQHCFATPTFGTGGSFGTPGQPNPPCPLLP